MAGKGAYDDWDGKGDGPGGDAGNLAEEASPIQVIGAKRSRDREHDLSVRHGRQERGVQLLRPDGEALGVATRTEVPALARLWIGDSIRANPWPRPVGGLC